MKKYQSHKIVDASEKCSEIRRSPAEQEGFFNLQDDAGEVILVKDNFFARGEPTGAFYIMEYEDGYRSFSPAEAFENGYTEVVYTQDAIGAAAENDWKPGRLITHVPDESALRMDCLKMTNPGYDVRNRIRDAATLLEFIKHGSCK